MGRKSRKKTDGFQWVREDQDDEALEPIYRESHREIREDDAEVAAMVDQLLALSHSQRARLDLAGPLNAGLIEHGRLSGSAGRRHYRRLKKLVRGHDRAALQAALEEESDADRRARRLERWRTRIVEEGDPAIQAFVEAHPTADRPALRALARQADPETPAGKRAFKKLFQVLSAAPPAEPA